MSCEAPRNDYERALCEALARFRAIALPHKHVVSVEKKARINQLIRMIEALQKGNIDALPIKQKINELVEDILALYPVVSNKEGIGGELTVLKNLSDIRKRIEPYELIKIGPNYFIKHLYNGTQILANGHFVFVVTVAAPYRVMIGERIDGGHTAISRGSDVYYAGEISFAAGALVSWKNESGHYHPPSGLQTQIRNLLPLDRFVLAHL